SLPLWGKNAQLLQQAQGVHLEPMLDALATRDADDVDDRARRLLAGWGDAHKSTLLCATRGEAGHDLVPLSDHVLNRDVQVRESRQIHADELSGSLDPTWRTGRGRVIDLIGIDELIDGSDMLLVEDLLVEMSQEGLVVFS